jgi:hypothetical protein
MLYIDLVGFMEVIIILMLGDLASGTIGFLTIYISSSLSFCILYFKLSPSFLMTTLFLY